MLFAVLQGCSTTIYHSSFIRTQFSLHLPALLLQQIPGWCVCFSYTLCILCTDQEYFLLPIFILIVILSAFFGGGDQLDTSWSHLGRGSLSQGIISNQIDPWTSLCVIFLVDDWYWWVAPSLGRWTWDGCMRNLAECRQENKQVSSLCMVPTTATACVPALISLCDGLWWSHVSQISSFFPKLLLAIAEKQTIIFAYCFV